MEPFQPSRKILPSIIKVFACREMDGWKMRSEIKGVKSIGAVENSNAEHHRRIQITWLLGNTILKGRIILLVCF